MSASVGNTTGKIVKRLYLVRHGETNYNVENRVQGRGINSDLNDRGVQQARLLAKRFLKEPVDFIASSTMKRAHQTASIILQEINNLKNPSSTAEASSAQIINAAALIENAIEKQEQKSNTMLELSAFKELEEMDFGEMEGHPFDPKHPQTIYPELQKIINGWKEGILDTTSAAAPGGETPIQVAQRSVSAIEQILNKGFTCGVVVCHGRLLKVLLCSLLKIPLQEMHKMDQHNCAVNILEFEVNQEEGKETVKSIRLEEIDFKSVKLNCTDHLKELGS